MGQIVRMTNHLDQLNPVEKTNFSDCLNELANRMGRREIVMIFSDFFGDLTSVENAVHRLRYQKHEVVLFQILHHDELAFEFDGMVKFVGLEIPDELLTQPEELRQAYLEAFGKYQRTLEELSQQNGCELVQVDTSRPMGELFIDYLHQRSRITHGR